MCQAGRRDKSTRGYFFLGSAQWGQWSLCNRSGCLPAAAGDQSSPLYAGAGRGYLERSLPTAWHSDIRQHLSLLLKSEHTYHL